MNKGDLVERLRGLGAIDRTLLIVPHSLLTQAADEIARLRGALERQCDNMAFVLNKATLPDQWYSKFCNELEQDRAALQHKEPQG